MKTDKILQRLVDKTLPKEYRELIRYWLISEKEESQKEVALQHFWENVSQVADETIENSLQETHRKIKSSGKFNKQSFSFRHIFLYAAILTVPLLVGITGWWISQAYYENIEMLECYVPYGELRTILLPDGSEVQLNAGSTFIYPQKFSTKKRTVYLSGEANFSVKRNKSKPFLVHTGIIRVEVIGTKFNVEAYPGSGDITTTLEQGAVKVYKEGFVGNAILMKPDEQLIYLSHEDRFIKTNVDPSDYTIWINGELRFRNKTLDDILFTLERKYDVRFLVDQSVKHTDMYSVRFKAHETIEDVLYVLSQILGTIDYQQEGQTIRLFPKGKEVTR